MLDKYTNYDPNLAVVRGAGDLATGVIQKLYRAGFKVLALETSQPTTIRRTVALSSAVLDKSAKVEDLYAFKADSLEDCQKIWDSSGIPVLVDPQACCLNKISPLIMVDAIIAKKNLGTHKNMAPITIAIGPGFYAPEDVDAIVESCRGHELGSLIEKGSALPNTGIPGRLGGKSVERVIYAPCGGPIKHFQKIGDILKADEIIMQAGSTFIRSPFAGILRGLISDKIIVSQGLKIADVDPRPASEVDYLSISDKARSLGGAVLEGVFYLARKKNLAILTKPSSITERDYLRHQKSPHDAYKEKLFWQ